LIGKNRSIYSYGRQGLNKPCLKSAEAEAHAVIYSSHAPIPTETKTTKLPIAVQMTNEGDSLDETSRLNFQVVSTVEKNQKVLNYGKTTPEGLKLLCAYYAETELSENAHGIAE
jgi:mRNA-degrading endonuclease toxin of MazEF toxin-antitoxin module